MPSTSQPINREELVGRHRIRLTAADAQNPLTVGNGDFAYTADVTGMQTFRDFHDPDAALREGRSAVNTCTMSTWGWHEMPNPEHYSLPEAMSEYATKRGNVLYADKYDVMSMYFGDIPDDHRAGAWLHVNPQRLDLGRIGMELRPLPDGAIESNPAALSDIEQVLDLWTGSLSSTFTYAGEPVTVTTTADPHRSAVAFRIASPLLRDGRLTLALRFAYPSDLFHQPNNWEADDRHTSILERVDAHGFHIQRHLDETNYSVTATLSDGAVSEVRAHHFRITAIGSEVIELVVEYGTTPPHDSLPTVIEVTREAAESWRRHWTDGAIVDFSDSEDPRATELERRVITSQYLTAVNSSGVMPPQETGLVTNSWQGKAHLEMHWWHAAHFALWGRTELLSRSLNWYKSILDDARRIAARQGYDGARWPKQVGPDGRESPDNIGTLLIWQQPHILYFAELIYRADPTDEVVAELAELVEETARFMASFVEDRDGTFHLPSPLGPAQEVYDAHTAEDPTFELGYWWWGLEIANRWRERLGLTRDARWSDIQQHLARPHQENGIYTAIATAPYLKREDHPSMIAVLGVLPETPLSDGPMVLKTIQSVIADWKWDSAWGWDFPVMAMAATRAGDPRLAIDSLLMDAEKNHYLANGHNPQMPNIIPVYLPSNGGLLAAISLMVAGWDGSADAPGLPEGWRARHEGLRRWP